MALFESQVQAQNPHVPATKSAKKQLAQGLYSAPAARPAAVASMVPAAQQVKALAIQSYPSGHLQRGLFLKQKGRQDEALVEFLKAVQENPRQVKAFYEQALIFQGRGADKLARSALEQALAINPAYDQARQLLIKLHVQSGDLLAAAGEFGKSLALAPAEKKETAQTKHTQANSLSLVPVFKVAGEKSGNSVASQVTKGQAQPSLVLAPTASTKAAAPETGPVPVDSVQQGESGTARVVDSNILKNLIDHSVQQQEQMIKEALAAADREEKAKVKVAKAEPDSKISDSSQPLLERLGSGPMAVKNLTAEQQRLVSMVSSSPSQTQEKSWTSKFKHSFVLPKLPLPAVSLPTISLPSFSFPTIKIPFLSGSDRQPVLSHPLGNVSEPVKSQEKTGAKPGLQAEAMPASEAVSKDELPVGVAKVLESVAAGVTGEASAKSLPELALPVPANFEKKTDKASAPSVTEAEIKKVDELEKKSRWGWRLPGKAAKEEAGEKNLLVAETQKVSAGFSKFIDDMMKKVSGKKSSSGTGELPLVEKNETPAKIVVANSLLVENFGQKPESVEPKSSLDGAKNEKKDLPTSDAVALILNKIESPLTVPVLPGSKENPLPALASSTAEAVDESLQKIVQNTIESVQSAVPNLVRSLFEGETALKTYRSERLDSNNVKARSFVVPGSSQVESVPVLESSATALEGKRETSVPAAPAVDTADGSSPDTDTTAVPLPRDVAAILAKLDVRVPAPASLPRGLEEGNNPRLPQPRTLEAKALEPQPAPAVTQNGVVATPLPAVRNTPAAELSLPLPKAPAVKPLPQQEHLVPKPIQDVLRQAENYLPKPIFEALVNAMVPENPSPLSLGGSGMVPSLPSLAASKAAGGQADVPQPIPAQIIDFIGKLAVPSLGSVGSTSSQPPAAPSFRWLSPTFDNANKPAVTGSLPVAPAPKPAAKPLPKPAVPVKPADPILTRMQYLLEHGTSSLRSGEAFMYSEETGEGLLFMADGHTERRKLSAPKDAETILKERRPDILLPKDMQYNLTLLGKVMPHKQQTAPRPPITGITLEDLQKREAEKGAWDWLKNPFRF